MFFSDGCSSFLITCFKKNLSYYFALFLSAILFFDNFRVFFHLCEMPVDDDALGASTG